MRGVSILDEITPVILTLNEAPNIKQALAGLGWAKQIIVVDSGSTDGTLEFLKSDHRVRLFQRSFDTHFGQWLFAVTETGITTPWMLRLDADYQVTQAFVAELAVIDPATPICAYRVAFDYSVLSHRLIASLYPPKPILLRMGTFTIIDLGHTEGWELKGPVGMLQSHLVHDDWKSMDAWVPAQARYMRRELLKIEERPKGLRDWLRLHPPLMPIAVFFHCLFVKGLIINGRAGLHYTLQRVIAESVLALMLVDERMRRPSEGQD